MTNETAAVEERTRAAVEAIDSALLVGLAVELGAIPSPLGAEEDAARCYQGQMERVGLRSRLQPISRGRANALARLEGRGGGPSIMLNGHLETHSEQSASSTFVPVEEIDGRLRGTGIWNMKGSLAAYLTAASALRESGPPLSGDVLIAGVAGAWDETIVPTRLKGRPSLGYGFGTRFLIDRGSVADFGIVGEPTSFRLLSKHLGQCHLRVDITREREPAPSGTLTDFAFEFPFPSDRDTVEHGARMVLALSEWSRRYREGNAVDGYRPWVAITSIEGGAPGTLTEARQTSINLVVSLWPGAQMSSRIDELRAILRAVDKDHDGLRSCIETTWYSPGPFVDDSSRIVRALQNSHDATFGEPLAEMVAGWYSDASPMVRAGIATVNYGPSGVVDEHGESVAIADLLQCVGVYVRTIIQICGA